MSDFTLPEPLKDQAQTAAPQFALPTPATHTLTENEKSSGIFEAIQQMSDPEEGRARLIVAKHIADRLGVTTSEVFRDIDNYTQKYYKETRPAKDWLSTVIDEGKIQAGTMKLGNLGYQHARARTQEEADKIWEQIQVVKQSLPSPDTISRNIPVELIKQTYGLMAQMAATVPESWDVGALTALGAVGVGAAVGAPIALGTAIAAYIAGGTGKTEYGNAYLDMIDKGISTDVARSYSYGPGILNGLIEGGQMMTLFKGVPAVSKALDDAAKKTLRNVWISKVLENKATKFIAMRGADIALETAQEVAQESVTMTFDHMAIVFENEARDAGIPDYTIEDVKTRIGEIAKQSAMGFAGLSLLGAGVRGSISAVKKAGEKGKAQVTAQDKAQVTTEATTGTQALTVEDREAELDTILKALETNPADKDLNAKRIQVSDELDALEEAKPIEIQEPATMPNLTGDDWLAKKRMEAENSLDTEADWTPSEVLRYKILDSFQGVDESNVDALTSFVDLVAKNQGMTGDQFLSKNFTPEIITKDKAEGSIAQGENRGGMTFINEETGEATSPLDWANLKVSKALMHVGPGSDVSTFFHEFTHAVVGVGLNDEQRGILETAYSKPLQEFTIADLEDVATKAEAYFASGESPTPELRSLYEKIRDMITRFIARLQGTVQLSPELKAFYDSLVASKPMALLQSEQTQKTLDTSSVESNIDAEIEALRATLEKTDPSANKSRGKYTDQKVRNMVEDSKKWTELKAKLDQLEREKAMYPKAKASAQTIRTMIERGARQDGTKFTKDEKAGLKEQLNHAQKIISNIESKYNTLFQGVQEQRDESGNLIAPNGEPSNLTPFQWKQVRTEAFKSWFGPFIENYAIDSLIDKFSGGKASEMSGDVFSAIKDSQILDPIISSIPIDVVNNLGGEELASKMLFENPSMFIDIASAGRTNSQIVADFSGIIAPSGSIVAVSRAKLSLAKPTASNAELFAAIDALQNNLIFLSRWASTGELSKKTGSRGIANHPLLNALSVAGLGAKPTSFTFGNKAVSTDFANVFHNDNYTIHSNEIQAYSNASKVVDENGEPLVVYHGTPLILNPEYLSRFLALVNDPNRPYGQEFSQAVEEIEKTYPATYEQNKFDIFDLSRSGDIGAHFTEDKTVARKFADSSSGEGTVLEVYLNIRDLKETGDIFSRYQRLYEAIEEFRDNELITDAEFESLAPTAEKLDNKDYDDDRDWGTSKGVINFWKRINKYLTKKKGNVSGIEYRNTVEGGGTSYVVFSPTQIKSATGNTGTFDPNNPNILYQPGDSELVRKAVEQNEWVDDELLSRFASEEWASDEIKKRAMDRRTAGEYEDMDEFIRDSIALSIDPTNDEILYYAQLWKTRDLATETIPASREEQNRNFVASLDKPGLEALLSAIAGANQEDLEGAFGALGHGLFASAIKTVMKGGHISDAHYKKLMDQVNYNPTSFRESVYSLLEAGDEYRAFMEEVSTDPTLAELEKRKQQLSEIKKELATKNLSIESATQEIERARFYIQNLEKKTLALEDALSSAQEEAKKGEKSVTEPYVNALSSARAESRMAVSRAKREKEKEIRNFYKARDAMQKMIKVIMAPPSKSMNYEYQKRLLDLQAGYTKGLGKRGTQARQEMLKRDIPPEIRAELEKELSAVNVKKMSFEELQDLADMVKGIRQAGIDAQKLNLLNWRLMLGENWSKILETLKPFMKEAVFGKTSKSGQKQTRSTLGKVIQFSTLTPERVAELLDGGKEGIFHRLLIEEVNGVTDDADSMIKQRLGKVQEAMKKYGINAWKLGRVEKIAGFDYTRHQILGFYIQNQNVDSRKALLDGDNLTEQDVYSLIQTLTNEERAFADELMDIVGNDQEFQRLEIAVGENRNELMDQVEKYFPMLRLNMEGTGSLDAQVAGEILDRSGKGRPGVRFGGRISRVKVGKKNQTPIRHDVINVAVQQIMAQEKYIAMQGQVKKLAAIFNNNEVRNALVSAYGDKAPQWITKYLNDLAIPNFYNDQISRTSKMLRSNAAVAYLAFNALTILKQLPSLAFYLADAGPVAMISASGEFLSHPIQTVKLVRSLDPQMASRSFDRVMEELKTMDKSGYERAVKKVGQWGMAGIMMMDTVATTIGWKAVYNKEMSIHADPVKAMRRAQEVTMRTQPSSRVQNLAEIYRSNEGLNWILMFTNQLNKIWNIASFDIPQAWNNGEFGKAGAYAFSIAISGIAMGMIARKDIPDEPEDVGQAGIDILAQLLSSIPVVGGNIVQGASGWGSTGVDPLPMFSQLGATGKTIVDPDKDMEQKLESTLKLILEGCVAAGIPQIATKRSIKAFFDDTWDLQFDPWELIGGHPEE